MNAIAMLKKDHREVEGMLKKIEKGVNGRERQKLIQSIVRELAKHAAVEEQIVYPFVRRRIPKLESEMLKSLEEHHIMKVTLSELETLKPTDERLLAKIEVLADEFRTHYQEEERTIFPALERALGAEELSNMGNVLERAKKVAPTHAHPLAPDTPPGNLVAGVGAALVDRTRDAARSAGRTVIDRVVRRTGNGAARARTQRAARGRTGARASAHAR